MKLPYLYKIVDFSFRAQVFLKTTEEYSVFGRQLDPKGIGASMVGIRILGFSIPRVSDKVLSVYNFSLNLYWPTVLMAFGYSAEEDIQEGSRVTTASFLATFMFGIFTIEVYKWTVILADKEPSND